MKTVLFVLLDAFADWEAAFLAPALRGGLMPGQPGTLATQFAAPGCRPVRSIGGMTVHPDRSTESLPDDCAGLVLAGGMGWRTPEAEPVAALVRQALARGLTVGAICNAASFLAAHGFLNDVRHTGNSLEMLREWGGAAYTGEALFCERQAVRDGQIVTANGTGFLEFTRECLLALEAYAPEAVEGFYAFSKNGIFRP